jgi:dihydrofolate synthase/folylpolyglutamate synthase
MSRGIKALKVAVADFPAPPPFLHIGGTNGKGSLCEYLFTGALACNVNTALFTSPHIHCVTERIRGPKEAISKKHLQSLRLEVEKLTDASGLTFFEYSVLMFLLYCRDIEAELAIVEVGLGGSLDSTNALEGKIACALTSISLDHTEVLGNTVEKIAWDKSGIARPEIPMYVPIDLQPVQIIQKRCLELQSPLISVPVKPLNLKQKGLFQPSLASMALKILSDLGHNEDCIQPALEALTIAGRLESVDEMNVLLDVCHNAAGFLHLYQWLMQNPKDLRTTLYFTLMREKDVLAIVSILQLLQLKTQTEIVFVELKLDRGLKKMDFAMPDWIKSITEDEFLSRNLHSSLVCGSFHLLELFWLHYEHTIKRL